MDVQIESSWKSALEDEFSEPYFQELHETIHKEYKSGTIVFPPSKLIFNAFNLCPFDNVKVVILGQDPYHGQGQAHGLSFSVPEGIKPPPSLQNIYKEISKDLNQPIKDPGDLTNWAEQGVLLLNATLTVLEGQPGSHQRLGWETFTDSVIRKVSDEKEHVVFLLWGKYAQAKESLIDENKHLILKAPHPSPFSAYTGFLGCKHFSKTNKHLISQGIEPIRW